MITKTLKVNFSYQLIRILIIRKEGNVLTMHLTHFIYVI